MSGEVLRFAVPDEGEGARLDAFLADRLAGRSRSSLRRFILEGRVSVDGRPAAKPGQGLRTGMRIEIALPDPRPDAPAAQDLPLDVVHEDPDFLVVNKPSGLVVHPGHGRRDGTLVNALLGRGVALAPAGGRDRPGIVHRLDLETSGLIVVAKTDRAHLALQRAFAERRVRKTYLALVWGRPDPPEGSIDRAIGRSRANPTRMAVNARRSREARTTYRIVESLPGCSLLRVAIETGRTHQIRVHLQSIGHSVVGDARYGRSRPGELRDPGRRAALRAFHRIALHAAELSFPHPVTGVPATFRAPLPEAFEALLVAFRSRE